MFRKKLSFTLVLLCVLCIGLSAKMFEPQFYGLFSILTGEIRAYAAKDEAEESSIPTACVPPDANLISWYRAEGNASDEQGANNGTLGSSAIFTAGKVGQAFQTISANGSTVSIPDSASLDFTNAFTIEMWVSPTQAGTSGGTSFFACKGDCGSFSNQSYSLVFSNTQQVFFRVGNSSTFDSLGTPTILPLNTFSHIAGTYDGSTMRIYVNGVLDNSKTTTTGTLANSSQPFIIGGSTGSGNALGIYDETSLYNRALTDAEIAAIFNAGSDGKCDEDCTPQAPDGISWYKGENNGNDSLGTNNGTFSDGVTFAPGKVGQSFDFSNLNGVNITNNAAFNQQNFTVETWVTAQPYSCDGCSQFIVAKSGTSGTFGFELATNREGMGIVSGALRFTLNGGAVGADMFDDVRITDGNFHHVAASYDGTTMKIYLDGVLTAQQPMATTINFEEASRLVIGSRQHLGSVNPYNGLIDELGFYNRTLSDAEIASIFNAGSSGKCPTSSTLVVTNANDTGSGSLRDAILSSNSTAGTQTISFNIPQNDFGGTGFFNIAPLTPLPVMTDSVIIDGTTQPGFSGSPVVEIDGRNLTALTNPVGLDIRGGNSTVRGLSVINFRGPSSSSIFRGIGISLEGTGSNLFGGNKLEGNFIGVRANGTGGGNYFGVNLSSTNNIVGGPAENRNAISGNTFGVLALTQNNTVEGNFIGTSASGTTAIGNLFGISLLTNNTTIRNNVVSGNSAIGIHLPTGATNNNLIENNLIGLDASGVNPIANGAEGIYIESSTASGNRLTANRISTNNALGIKLGNGRTGSTGLTNDTKDPDDGTNGRQNHPLLTSVVPSGGTTVSGTLNSTPSQTFRLEFFSNPTCDPSGFGEGELFIGSTNVNTDAGGITGFTTVLPATVASGRFVTATATDANGNTSEFSRCQVVSAVHSISGRVTDNGASLVNAEVRLTSPANPAFNRSTTTNRSGDYSFNFIPAGGDYRITVVRANRTFSPPNRNYVNLAGNQINQDFTTVPSPARRISGRIMSIALVPNTASRIGQGLAAVMPPAPTGPFAVRGVTLTLSGAANATFTSDNNGNYRFDNLQDGQNYTITPSKPNYVFTPPSVSFEVVRDRVIDFSGESLGLSTLTGRIIYETRGDIEAMNANGSGIVTLATAGPRTVTNSSPRLSSDGSRAILVSRKSNGVRTSIVTMNSDGSNRIPILTDNNGLFDPSWSRDGSKIAFNNSSRQLLTMSADGSNIQQITSDCTEPDWSPDGLKLVCVRTPNFRSFNPASAIITIDANGSNETTFSSVTGRKNAPRWSPDGSLIAFINYASDSRIHSLILLNADGSNSVSILSGGNSLFQTLTWSPDGARLALIRERAFVARNVAFPPASEKQLVTLQADGQALLVIESDFKGNRIDWKSASTLPTPAGTNVNVQAGSVSLTFAAVNGENAITTVTPIPPDSAGTVPSGFSFNGMAFEISTTANFTPPVTICLVVANPPRRGIPHIFHNENGTMVDIFTTYDRITGVVCGETDSFSPFAVAEEIDVNFPSISGLILDESGNPVSGADVSLTGTDDEVTHTDSEGFFSFINLTAGGNYNVQPRKVGFLFTEYNQDLVNVTGENAVVFTGLVSNFEIGGQVVNGNGEAVMGAVVRLDGAEQLETITDAAGNYSFTELPADGNYLVTASNGTNSFSPPNIFIDALTTSITGADFVQFAPTAAEVSVSGRVLAATGRGISKVRVSIGDSDGNSR
ncbi:MAG: carboxypeptidase regulatory-like domain-containing protein, partial [Saprospiraceae bacterium]|nr:carboxypeptidase regulatory-like domain-containing protein [Pyrinomonadaceae bacterium]